MDRLKLRAPAKINLSLHVIGRRADGYHLLESVVAFAESSRASDSLYVARSVETSLDIAGTFADEIPKGSDNIVLRAVRIVANNFPEKNISVSIRLIKNLPPAAGLGGGSSDATAILRALSILYNIAEKNITSLAASLGADLPVCLQGHASMMTGIGEHVTPLPRLPILWAVLINPKIPVATQEIFQAFDSHGKLSESHPSIHADMFASAENFVAWLHSSHNNLQSHSLSMIPKIREILDMLGSRKTCLLARMSGSGATCFGLYKSEPDAKNAAKELIKFYDSSAWIVATPIY